MVLHYYKSPMIGTILGTTTGACGTEVSNMKFSYTFTAVEANVTCKRCLKTLETGSAHTGTLARYAKKVS